MKVQNILSKLSSMHHFFDNPPCCWYSSKQKDNKLEYNVFLRSRVIPFIYFIEKQKRIKTLALPKQMPAPSSTQQQQQNSQSQRSKPSIIVIDRLGDQTLYGTIKPQSPPLPGYDDASNPLSQVADPFVVDSGGLTHSINNNDHTQE